MPKLKTNKTAAKRIVGITSSGKIRVRRTSAQHLASHKPARTRHGAALKINLNAKQSDKLKKSVPYII